MIESHYAPRAKLRLAVDHVNPGEALLAFARLEERRADELVAAGGRIDFETPFGDHFQAFTQFHRIIKAHLALPDDEMVVCGMSMGCCVFRNATSAP